ncbi:putative ankyrin repeat protein [Cotonvirus japonicus]|uniref:Ankyrin repeat protein n=1 Tax=Cotonvirus japonicus TaxID=2811091 RepID=A0ABM7NQU9_9VIRU|nr:putative ankyrin repeat protein [Cotonvirus japonicus]BCS82538.1 putative ankyrin repeat protein [Cotonvirus japonicus]
MNKEILSGKIFFTLLDSDLKFNGFQFKEGLNIQEKFYPPSNKQLNKILFVDINNVRRLLNGLICDQNVNTETMFGVSTTTKFYLAELNFPINHTNFKFIHLNYEVYCANMACLGNCYRLDDIKTYENLISLGSKINASDIIRIADGIKSKSLLEQTIKKYNITEFKIYLFKTIIKNNYEDIIDEVINNISIEYADIIARLSCEFSDKIHLIDKLINTYGVNIEIIEEPAVLNQNIELLEYLLSKEFDVQKAFYYACRSNKPKIIKYLIDKGVDPLSKLSEFNSNPNKFSKYAISSLKKYLEID